MLQQWATVLVAAVIGIFAANVVATFAQTVVAAVIVLQLLQKLLQLLQQLFARVLQQRMTVFVAAFSVIITAGVVTRFAATVVV